MEETAASLFPCGFRRLRRSSLPRPLWILSTPHRQSFKMLLVSEFGRICALDVAHYLRIHHSFNYHENDEYQKIYHESVGLHSLQGCNTNIIWTLAFESKVDGIFGIEAQGLIRFRR
nr:hypothetical protein Itr_chr11CG02590 [Ipomoea trifida]